MAQRSYGSITIVDTNDIERFYVQYAKNNSSATAPSSGWSQTRPEWQNGTYIWQRTVAKRQGVALAGSDYGTPVCITGEKGQQGIQGNTGKGISSIVTTYCNYAQGTPVSSYSGWSSSVPAYDSTKPNYWVKTVVNYTSGNPSTTIYKDLGITEATQKANLAVTTANTAEANSIQAIAIADGKNKIYYANTFNPASDSSVYNNGDTLFYKTNNGTIMYVYDSTYTDATSGHWRQQQFEENAIANLAITNAKINDLHGNKITANTIAGNKIIAHDITANQLATNAIQSSNYTAGTAPYSTAGTFLDLTQGNIYTPNFGVNNTAILENNQIKLNIGAYIKGSIYAYNGTIGSNTTGNNPNYWYIGDYQDYNQNNSALIKGYGTATIQLGNTSTWRLNTNRIHTAWYDDNDSTNSFRLHYLNFDSEYWDLGFHVPTSVSDKFIYIRKTSTENSLAVLQSAINDNANGTNTYWNYQFYVTNDGSLYAKNIYIKDTNGNDVPVGGSDGVYLLKSGGTITGNLQVNGSYLNKDGNALTLQTNLGSTTAGTLTGNTSSVISIGVTGTLPSTSGGTGNVNWNQGGVVYIDGSSPKKLLSTAAGTSGYLLQSNGTGAPTWINPATLTVAAATKATQDGDGNVIKTTYLKLSGGNVTGPVSFGDSVSIDDLNAGTLVVTGNASFVNNVNVDSINGVQVGETPKFTDTVTTITTSGNGNAITAITASNGVLTATKGSTFLTGITSSQVTTALGYTPYNATNPNGYTNNTGTVKKVRVQASSPLQSSTSTEQSVSLDTTISFVNQNTNVVLAGPSSGSAAAPAFRALVAADIPTLTKSKISDFPTVWALSSVTGADDLKAIEALEGTSGLLKKTGANTWTLDTNTYVTSSGVTSITLTQGTGISIGSSGTAITSTGTRTISLADNYGDTKNPYASKTARYVLAAPAAANGAPSFRALTKADVGLNNVLNYGQVTAIGQGDNGTLRVWTGDPTSTSTDDYEDIAITITAYNQSTVSKAGALNLSAAVGSTSKPVYFKADGKPYEISYTIEKSVPSNAVFTDTWNKVSTAQDGYVTKLPGNTTTFLRGDGTWGTPGGTYSLPLAANGTRGGVQIGYTENNKKYAVKLDNEKMYVEVPWTDNNTTYSAGTGLSLSGTTFNHSNSITAGTAGTSSATSSTDRTISIPYITYDAQGHITASGTHTHTLDSFPQAYLSWGGQNFLGTYGCIDAAMIPQLGANRFAFLKAAGLQIDYSTDAGATWISYGATDIQKVDLFANGGSFYLGKASAKANNTINNQLRIIITTNLAGIYTYLNKIAIYMSTNGNTTQVKIEKAKKSSPDNYVTHLDWTFITGWSGWNILNISGLTTYGNTDSQQQKIKITFRQTSVNSNYGSPGIWIIKGFGGMGWTSPSTMAKTGHLYSYDGNQNATFPAQITATQFNGLATKATGDKNGADIATTYLKLAGGTMSGVLTLKANQYEDSYSGALNMNNSNIYGLNSIYTADTSENAAEGIHFYRDSTHVDSLYAKSGVLYFTPNRALGNAGTDYSIYHTGNKPSKSDVGLGNVENTALSTWAGSSNLTTTKVGTLAAAAAKGVVTTLDTSGNLPTANAVKSYIDSAISNLNISNYVTLNTTQTISGTKTFTGGISVKSNTTTNACNINYNSSLNALIFSFA